MPTSRTVTTRSSAPESQRPYSAHGPQNRPNQPLVASRTNPRERRHRARSDGSVDTPETLVSSYKQEVAGSNPALPTSRKPCKQRDLLLAPGSYSRSPSARGTSKEQATRFPASEQALKSHCLGGLARAPEPARPRCRGPPDALAAERE